MTPGNRPPLVQTQEFGMQGIEENHASRLLNDVLLLNLMYFEDFQVWLVVSSVFSVCGKPRWAIENDVGCSIVL